MRVKGDTPRTWLAGSLACCTAAFLAIAAFLALPALTSATQPPSTEGTPAPSIFTSFVIPGIQTLDEGQQTADEEQSRRASPAAFLARERSRTEFAHLGAARAARVARDAFPNMLDRPAGGPPPLPTGVHVARYISATAAQLTLPQGKHAVVQSTEPMDVQSSHGHRAPIDLSVTRNGQSFQPLRPAVRVLIPRRAGEGVRLPESGLSLTPVDAHGSPLGGSPAVLDGATVLYANTQTDADTLIKPTAAGVEANTVLRSISSPNQLYFRVGLPAGATLAQSRGAGGPVTIVKAGAPIAMLAPPTALDAAHTPVAVSMTLSGDLLHLTVGSPSQEPQWPVNVDPELKFTIDTKMTPPTSNWLFKAHQESHFTYSQFVGSEGFHQFSNTAIESGEWMDDQYETQGESQIYQFEANVYEEIAHGRSLIQFSHEVNKETNEGVVESSETLGENGYFSARAVGLCAHEGESPCSRSAGHKHNLVWYKQIEIAPNQNTYALNSQLYNTKVFISQEKGPEVSFNTASPTIVTKTGTRPNALYAGGSWLSPTSGAIEATSHDPGIGISREFIQGLAGSGFRVEAPIYESGKCAGVQCQPTYTTPLTYTPGMANGEDTVELYAEDATGMFAYLEQHVNVDAAAPFNLGFTGMPEEGAEISAAPHTLTVHATDGTTPTVSSGVESIGISIDGAAEVPVPNTGCNLGPCTTSGKWTLNAENLTEGVHRLAVTATDNAGNIATREFTFDVRHGDPVSVGPGTVDPTTGQFKLSATDVSLEGAGGVSRVYESRNPTAGAAGPLGPQWAIGLGGDQGLTVLPDGSVVLTGSGGGVTTFTPNAKEKGQFESPLGDGNLKVEAKEKEAGKGITEYLLNNTTTATTSAFAQPIGNENTTPLFTDQFGAEGVNLNRPAGIAIDSSGNEWVADYSNNRVLKFSPTGAVLASYGSQGTSGGEFISPREIAINQSNGHVYVSDEGNNRIVELNSSGAFLATFGWGVTNGKNEFQTCESFCSAGIAGSGAGQFSEPKGVTLDSGGNVWVVDRGNNRLEEFAAGGEYLHTYGSKGAGEVQFEVPQGILFAAGKLYVAEQGNNRVQELSTAGKYEGQFGKLGTGNGEFKEPRDIAVEPKTGNLYVTDTGNNRVQEFSSTGAFITKFGSSGTGAGQFSEPKGVAVSAAGAIFVSDYNNNRIENWTRQSWLQTRSEAHSIPTSSYVYKAVEVEGKWVIQLQESKALEPTGVTCGTKPEELKKGCRALLFTYATKTSATGEAPSEWGEYNGQLKTVSLKAYNPTSKAMEEKAVASYSYDKQARLRSESNPQLSTLKTTYGYDAESHVVAISPPGVEPWLLHYGALAGDPNTGRLLSVTRPAAASTTVLKEQKAMAAPVNTGAPTLSSSTPAIGTTLSVSGNGTWSNSPLSYAYQWKSCNGAVCSPIAGATNQSYTPTAATAGYTLVAQVAATNPDGLTVASTAASSTVPMPAPVFSSSFGSEGTGAGQFNHPSSDAVASGGEVWVADSTNNRLEEFSSSGTFMLAVGWGVKDGKAEAETCTAACKAGISGAGNAQFASPPSIAINQATGNLYVADGANSRVEELTSAGAFVATFGTAGSGNGQISGPQGIAVDPIGDVWVGDFGNSRIDEFTGSGTFLKSVGGPGTGAAQFKSPTGLTFGSGNLYVADYANDRVQELSGEGQFLRMWGWGVANGEAHAETCTSECRAGIAGSGAGQFSGPWDVGADPVNGELYVSDWGFVDHRIEAFNAAGTYLTQFGTYGSGAGQFSHPTGVAVTSSGVLFAVDSPFTISETLNDRVEKWTPGYSTNNPLPAPPAVGTNSVATLAYHVPLSGTGLQTMTESEVAKWGQTDDPTEAMALFPPDKPMGWPAKEYARATVSYMDAQGHTVNVYSPIGGITTTEYNATNEVVRTLSPDNRALALKAGSKSAEVSKNLDNESFYTPDGTELTETIGPEHSVARALGKEGAQNEQVLAREHVKSFYDEGSPEGKTFGLLTKTVDWAQLANKEEFEKRTTTIAYGGQSNLGWTLRKPTSVTKDSGGLNLTSTTKYEASTGNVIETRTPAGSGGGSSAWAYSSQFGGGTLAHGTGVALDSHGNVWVANAFGNVINKFSASGALLGTYGEWGTGNGQLEEPVSIAVNTTTNNVYVGDLKNNRVDEFNEKGEFVRKFGTEGAGNGQFKGASGIAISSGNVWVSDPGNSRVQEFNENGEFIKKFGAEGTGNGQFHGPAGIVFSGANVYVEDSGNSRVEEFNAAGEYVAQFGSKGTGNGQFSSPEGLTADSAGNLYVADEGNNRIQELTAAGVYVTQFGTLGTGNGQFNEPGGMAITAAGTMYVADAGNNRIEVFTKGNGNPEAHDSKTAYYSSGTESPIEACRNHPEWANLACQSEPVAQPGVAGLPELPVLTMTYNLWDNVEATKEKFGSVTRTKAQTYDAAGRPLTSEVTSTIDAALPTVTDKYNAETGTLEQQSTITEGKTKTLSSVYNTLGKLVKYTDADGNTTTYEYEPSEDTRLTGVNDGKGTQTYLYDPTTGERTKLTDSAAGTFTATYDLEGAMLTEGYPNGMTATFYRNQVGATTEVEYVKNTHCATKCPEVWFADSNLPSIHGETLKQTSTLSKENYAYDNAARLTETQETPTGKGCKTRAYAYDEEANRTSQTTRESATETCLTTGGSTQAHTYDSADRLIDPGVAYETFGDTTNLPASDAEGHELVSSYYVDGQVLTQAQNGESINYNYDPDGRTRETVSTGTKASTVISHYSDNNDSPTWVGEGGETWSRNIPGIDGALDAIQSSSGVTQLQLHDLQGDIVAKAADGETETKLISTYNSTEFGVPNEGKAPPTYAWLGAGGVSTELSSGVSTQGGASYVPQVARDLQTEPVVAPGAFPEGAGTGAAYVPTISGWSIALSETQSTEVIAEYSAEQEALRIAACEANPYSCDELEDPIHHYRAWEAKKKAETIWRILKEVKGADLLSQLGASVAELFTGIIVGLVSEDVAVGWFEDLAAKFEFCATELHSMKDPHGGCRLSYTGVAGSRIPYFFEKPTVSYCMKMSSDTVYVHECTLEVNKSEAGRYGTSA